MFVLLCVSVLLSSEVLFSLPRCIFLVKELHGEQQYFDCARRGSEWNFHSLSLSQNREMFIFVLRRRRARVQAAKRLSIRVVGNWRNFTARQVAYLKFTRSSTSWTRTTTKDSISSLSHFEEWFSFRVQKSIFEPLFRFRRRCFTFQQLPECSFELS